jgi:hypothetical protein
MAEQGGRASGQLSTGDGLPPPATTPQLEVGRDKIAGRFAAVIDCHGCNLHQIEVAIQANLHSVDPHPISPGLYVERHPVYLVAFDHANLDEAGLPTEGKPAELNMTAIREIFSARYPHISAEAPPQDGSHIRVPGMHIVGERDRHGNFTGQVRLGNPEDVD